MFRVQALGALVLERTGGEKFDSVTVQLCEHAAALLGPVLDIKRKDDRWLIQKAGDSLRDYVRKLIGPRHTILKAISYSLLFLILFFSISGCCRLKLICSPSYQYDGS